MFSNRITKIERSIRNLISTIAKLAQVPGKKEALQHAYKDSKRARTSVVCLPLDDQQQLTCSKYLPNGRISDNANSDITRTYAECDDTGVTRSYAKCAHVVSILDNEEISADITSLLRYGNEKESYDKLLSNITQQYALREDYSKPLKNKKKLSRKYRGRKAKIPPKVLQ